MPPNSLALAFAASIYPPAVAAVIALGRGEQLRSRVFAFVAAAFLITLAWGAVMLLLMEELGATSTSSPSFSSGIEIALGLLLLALAVRLHRARPPADRDPAKPSATSKIDRYLESRRLAAVLGLTLYIAPSPIYVGAVKAIADAQVSAASGLVDVLAVVVVMLWMIELPMLLLILMPDRAGRALRLTNDWFAANGRTVAIVASAGAGGYLLVEGVVGIPG